jgi:hypothetical protein
MRALDPELTLMACSHCGAAIATQCLRELADVGADPRTRTGSLSVIIAMTFGRSEQLGRRQAYDRPALRRCGLRGGKTRPRFCHGL